METNDEKKQSDGGDLPPAVAQQLRQGLLSVLDKEVEVIRVNFKEALNKQERLGIELKQLNATNTPESREECHELFIVLKECTEKLQIIKKQMLGMHQEVKHLMKRSDNLLKFRDRELNNLRHKQLQEEGLIAKSSPNK